MGLTPPQNAGHLSTMVERARRIFREETLNPSELFPGKNCVRSNPFLEEHRYKQQRLWAGDSCRLLHVSCSVSEPEQLGRGTQDGDRGKRTPAFSIAVDLFQLSNERWSLGRCFLNDTPAVKSHRVGPCPKMEENQSPCCQIDCGLTGSE